MKVAMNSKGTDARHVYTSACPECQENNNPCKKHSKADEKICQNCGYHGNKPSFCYGSDDFTGRKDTCDNFYFKRRK